MQHARRSILAAVVIALAGPRTFAQAPAIHIDTVPPFGGFGQITGTVSGVSFPNHRISVFIYIDGTGWWTKPTFASPTVPIDANGHFAADVTTGGSLDTVATIFCAAVVPVSSLPPPQAAGAVRVPELDSVAIDFRERYGRTLLFAGRKWAVKRSPAPVGPGGNYFSDAVEDVFVDAAGHLHVGVRHHDDRWWATEVILLERNGYGTYAIETGSELEDLDRFVTFGAFLWDPYGDGDPFPGAPNREIDLEDSRWGNSSDPSTSQFVVHPFALPNHVFRYALPDLAGAAPLTRFLRWTPHDVQFGALFSDHFFAFPPQGASIATWTFVHDPAANQLVPTEGRSTFRINAWPNNVELGHPPPAAPGNGRQVEIVIRDFDFIAWPSGRRRKH
ncbi:MAG: hypothetical protein ACKVWV_15635 [Planctomycetota bacterium]